MKIGFSTSVIQRGKTGVAQYVFALLRAMDQLPREDRFVLFVLEEDVSFFRDLGARFEIVTVAEKYRAPIRNIIWHQVHLPRLARELSLDVVHVPSYRRLPWSAPCARVGTIHDLAPFRVARKYDYARMFYGRVVVKQLARLQERIIAVSGNTAADLDQFFRLRGEQVKVVHNGLEHERFFPRPALESNERIVDSFGLKQPYLLYVARLEHPGKNHVRLIEAFERFKERTQSDWILALGGSDWHGAEVIHERIAQSPWKESIRVLGFVSDEDLPWLYSAAEGFIYPSLYEGFGMPPVEAMACGCPVICSNRGSLGEVVGDAAAIIDPEDVGSISETITRFFVEPLLRKSLIEKGLARAREFSWEKAARETLAVYKAAVEMRGERSVSPAILPREVESPTK